MPQQASFHQKKPGKSPGQSIAEYGLVMSLVALAGLASLMGLGGNMSDVLGKLINQASAAPSAMTGGGQSDLPPGTVASTPAPSSPFVPTAPAAGSGKGLTITLSSGAQINVPDFVQDVSGTVATAGINGTTAKMSSVIAEVARQMEAAGEISSSEANMLIQLANEGHKIASIEQVVEQMVADGQMGTGVTYNGVKYDNPGKLAMSIGQIDIGGEWKFAENSAGFDNLLQQINASGMLKDPAISELVNALGNDILHIADQSENGYWPVLKGTVGPEDYVGEVASRLTNIKSGQICNTGNGTDSGTQCSG